jgi:hypothetical protein
METNTREYAKLLLAPDVKTQLCTLHLLSAAKKTAGGSFRSGNKMVVVLQN